MNAIDHRALEIALGLALVVYCGHAVSTGEILGKFRLYRRRENPWPFWTGVVITLGVGIALLCGAVSWRS